MAVATKQLTIELEDLAVIARAADAGFRLVQCETPNGHVTWEWRRGLDPRPQFTNRHVAVHWMDEFLAHDHGVPFVSEAGHSAS